MQFRESRLIKRGNRRSWYKPPTDKSGARLCLNELLQFRVFRLGLFQDGMSRSASFQRVRKSRVLLGQQVALAKIGSHASGPFCSTL
jgi:hypothetical protein